MTTLAIAADSHMGLLYMPYDAFTNHVASAWKSRVPRVVKTAEGKFWENDGIRLARCGYDGPGLTAKKRGNILVREGFASRY